jgi:hypothetical protein
LVGFDPALDRNGSKLIAGEKTLLYRKMIEQNKYLVYFPGVPVGRRLKERECLAGNIQKQFFDGASSAYYIANIMAQKIFMGRPLRALIVSVEPVVKSSFRCVYYWLLGKKPERFYNKLTALKNLMFIKLWVLSR